MLLLLQGHCHEDARVNEGRKPGTPLPGTLCHPARAQDRPGADLAQQVVFHLGHHAWNLVLLQSHSSPPPHEEMAPRKGNFVLKLCRSHFSRLLLLFSEVSPVSIPSVSGKNEGLSSESGRRWEACGQRQSGLAWAARWAPSLPLVGLRNSGGPGEAWKTELFDGS